jgi:hypothetical protein
MLFAKGSFWDDETYVYFNDNILNTHNPKKQLDDMTKDIIAGMPTPDINNSRNM